MRIDLHVHSKLSKRPSQWILKKIGSAESFTEPLQIYDTAKKRGMTHVTITDHNSIEGALEIAHLPNTYISEEVTSYFPEDGCKLHILALDITEAQHADIQKLRKSIFDLTAYLHQEGIFNIIAHPLYAVNDRLTLGHFERLLLLFQNFELNGARNGRENQTLRAVLNHLRPSDIERLSAKHGIEPRFKQAYQKKLFGGSDDHSSLNIGRTFTEFSGSHSDRPPLASMLGCRTRVHSTAPSPQTMAHSLYSLAWQFFRNKFDLERYAGKDPLIGFLNQSLTLDHRTSPGMLSKVYFFLNAKKHKRGKHPLSDSLLTLLRHETQALIDENPRLLAAAEPGGQSEWNREQQWFQFVNTLSGRVMIHFGNHLFDHLSGANVFNLFHTLGSTSGLASLLAPYFVAFSQFSNGRDLGTEVAWTFVPADPNASAQAADTRVAHFTDTFHEVNGVALTLQQQVRLAVKNGYRYTLVTCDDQDRPPRKGVQHFQPISTYCLPEYEQQKIFYPPLLEMLDYCHRQEFTHIHSATPGPIGLAALVTARLLQLPISGTYHTAIPQYVEILTGSAFMAELAWKCVLWYYDQMDVIYAPSQSTKDELVAKGLAADKIRVYPRGIDTARFHPRNRNGFYKKWSCDEKTTKLLYVGRVSREKNLPLLLDAYRRLVSTGAPTLLVIVGDGPYLDEMQKAADGLPCLFTGRLEGADLAAAYASSDIFVFPSATDTFGNVVLEAQASGLPAIVTDQGGACENIIAGKTGIIVKAGCPDALFSSMEYLVRKPHRRTAMGQAARKAMENRSFEASFKETWNQFMTTPPRKQAVAL